ATADRGALQKEISALKVEISRIAATTRFGDQLLLDGTGNKAFNFLVGAKGTTNEYISVSLSRTSGWGSVGLGVNTATVATSANAGSAIAAVDLAIAAVDGKRADLGAVQNRFQATIRNLTNVSENVSGARARIRDTDFAKETAELTRAQILQQTSQTVLAQANQRPQGALSLLQG
ncbi:flagellin, partial [Alishewanella sp. SMS9]|nr:flagellin [Alishewanella sp. SMS9]